MICETERLRDEANLENVDVHAGERPDRNDNADMVEVDAFDDNDRFGTAQSESVEEEVQTSQSQERYLSTFHLSQLVVPTEILGAPAHPINDNHVSVAATSVTSPGPVTIAILSEDPPASRADVAGAFVGGFSLGPPPDTRA